jgi:hypothetical protein
MALYSVDHAVGVARDLADRLNLRLNQQSGAGYLNSIKQTQDANGYPILIVSNSFQGSAEGAPVIWMRIANLFENAPANSGAPQDIFGNASLPFTPTVCQIAYELSPGTFVVSSASATAAAIYQDANGVQYSVASTIASQTALIVSGSTRPSAASGTLTKISGTGDATITYSAFSGYNPLPFASDYSVCLFEIARTGVVVQEYNIANGTAVNEANVDSASPAAQLKDIDWGYKGNT